MLTLEKHKAISKEVNNFMHLIKYGSGSLKIETKLELQMKNIFKRQASLFWKMEAKNDWLNKCYLQAQKDLSEIKKMGMSENPDSTINFIADLTEEWHDDINDDIVLNKVLKDTYISGYNFAGQEALNEFKIKESFKLRGINYLKVLDERANLTSPQINQTSWELVQNTIADGFWKEGKNPYKVARDLEGLFDETYSGRAENIARTETGEIVSEAQFEAYNKMGIPEMEWIAEQGACELCSPLRGQIVKTGEPFDNGQGWTGLHPLVHPSCRCDVAPVVGKEFVPSNYWTGE